MQYRQPNRSTSIRWGSSIKANKQKQYRFYLDVYTKLWLITP